MLNYIKSELYRAKHSAEIHGTAIGLLGLILFMNLVLYAMSGLPHFHYGITSFSYSMLVSFPMLYCYVAGDVAVMLYESDKRNGTLGNSIAYGISRTQIFAGKCIVSFLTALCLLALALPVYLLSSMLLEKAGPTTVQDMLTEVPAVSLVAIAALILAVLLLNIFNNSFLSILVWLAILVFLPKALLLVGMGLAPRTEFVLNIAMWMPVNFFNAGMQVNMSECTTVWDTAEGMARCLLSGAAGILVFGTAGVLLLKKKEI